MSVHPRPTRDDGFSLIEVLVAMMLLTVGLLGLAQVFYFGLSIVGTSSAQLIAREKAREAIESVHTARDTRVITWAQIRNVNAPAADCPVPTNDPAACRCGAAGLTANGGGTFLDGRLALLAPGADGLVQTADDTGAERTPGPDNMLNTADDIPLVGFRRQITICDITANPNVRQVVVTIQYNGSTAVGSPLRTYTLTTYISSFS